MKQNNIKNAWKPTIAVMLVVASLLAVSTAVSAAFTETVFAEGHELMRTSTNTHTHTDNCYTDVEVTVKCTLLEPLGMYSICTSGVSGCPGGRHNEKETWRQLTCGYN